MVCRAGDGRFRSGRASLFNTRVPQTCADGRVALALLLRRCLGEAAGLCDVSWLLIRTGALERQELRGQVPRAGAVADGCSGGEKVMLWDVSPPVPPGREACGAAALHREEKETMQVPSVGPGAQSCRGCPGGHISGFSS